MTIETAFVLDCLINGLICGIWAGLTCRGALALLASIRN